MTEKSEALQNIIEARRALARGDYTQRHNHVAIVVRQSWLWNVICQRDKQHRVTNATHNLC